MLLQLVLQFRGESLSKYRELEALEAQISSLLSGSESFDGIDAQENNVNVFFYTPNPAFTFERVCPLLEKTDEMPGFTAACRLVSMDRFRVLWPENVTEFSLRPAPIKENS